MGGRSWARSARFCIEGPLAPGGLVQWLLQMADGCKNCGCSFLKSTILRKCLNFKCLEIYTGNMSTDIDHMETIPLSPGMGSLRLIVFAIAFVTILCRRL